MVRSDKGSAGVMFTIDTESGFDDAVFVTSSYGLGEAVVQGAVNPDEFYVHKPGLREGRPAILKRQVGEKATKMIYTTDTAVGRTTAFVDVDPASALSQEEIFGPVLSVTTFKDFDEAIRVANELRNNNGRATHASLGVSVRPNSPASTPGAVVSDVTAGGPAAQAGIPKDAVVTKLDDRTIASGDALVAAVRSHAPGEKVTVTYVANGQTRTASVTLGTLTTN